MRRYLLITGLALILAGCNSAAPTEAGSDKSGVPAAQDTIRATLANPDTARFEDVRQFSDGVVCGKVDSRNDDGDYIGYSPFFVNPATGAKGVLLEPDGSVSDAIDVFPDECLPEETKAEYAAKRQRAKSNGEMMPSEELAADKGGAHGPALYDGEQAPSDLLASGQPRHERYGHRNPF
jgi:hypothetical protein